MLNFGKQAQERREQELQSERIRLQSLSEKEIMIEMVMELKRIDYKMDDLKRAIRIYNG